MTPENTQFIIQTGALGILAFFVRAMWMEFQRQSKQCGEHLRKAEDRIIELNKRIAALEIEAARRANQPSGKVRE